MDNQLYLLLRRQAIKLYLRTVYPLELKHRAKAIGKKEKIEVVFFAMNVAMWRYQGVYDLLSKEERFNCHIVFTVPCTFSEEQKMSDLQQMRDYFDSRGISYIDFDMTSPEGFDVRNRINPDILFYPQPYEYTFPQNHDFQMFKSKLWCYMLYSVNVIKANINLYDLHFHNLAWKIYCPTKSEKANAKRLSKNRGINWLVSGYPNLDRYSKKEKVDVWKTHDKTIKRLIWAPHFTLAGNTTWLQSRHSFLWLADLMVNIAQEYKGRLQIAFKPHPRLKSELYKHLDWGKEKTDAYYQKWAECENTQLETGDFIDLFMTSDAMIHDSGSFTAEYLYVNKPVAFVTNDINTLMDDHNEFGKAALNQHYILKTKDDVLAFINDVVLEGNDTKLNERTAFFNEVLKPIVTGTTSQFVVDDIKKSLRIKN